MKRHLLLLSFVVFTLAVARAQDDELPPPSNHPEAQQEQQYDKLPGTAKLKGPDLSKYLIEPGVHISFMQGGFNAGLQPYFAYKVWKDLYVGGGLTYMYTGYRNIGYADVTGKVHYTNASGNTYGGGALIQYNIWKGFFVRDRVELLHRSMDDVYNASVNMNPQTGVADINLPKVQKTMPDMLLGVGYNLLQTKSISFPVMFSYNALYSVTDKLYSLYPHGWVFTAGFIDVF